jgi:ADP-ribose pyrophosphatase
MTTRTEYQHPILAVETFPVEGRAGVHRFVRVRLDDWVNVVPITEDGQVVLVRQHRYGIDLDTLEVPGGAVDPGEEPETAALRELREETGYGGGRCTSLGHVWVNPAIQTNRCHLFAVEGVRIVGERDLDPTEAITVETVPASDIAGLVADGTISHSLAVVTLQRALLRGLLPV